MTGSFSRAGVEVGGTFTDLVYVENGRIAVAKAPSTPSGLVPNANKTFLISVICFPGYFNSNLI